MKSFRVKNLSKSENWSKYNTNVSYITQKIAFLSHLNTLQGTDSTDLEE